MINVADSLPREYLPLKIARHQSRM